MRSIMGKKKVKKGAAATVSFTDEQLQHILSLFTQADTEIVSNAEAQLEPFIAHHSCVGPLMNQVMGSQIVEVRIQAAIQLKRKISGHFGKFNPAEQAQLKAQFLQLITTEPDKLVATQLSGAIASVAHATFANKGSWDELFAGLMTLHKDDNYIMRVRNYDILTQLAEKISDYLKPNVSTIAQMMIVGCSDTVKDVKVQALKATTSFIQGMEDCPEVMAFEPVLRPLLGVMQVCMDDAPEVVENGLWVIAEAVDKEQPLVNGHIDSLVPFIVHIIENDKIDFSVRSSAVQTLQALVEHRPKLISKANMVPPILQAMTNLIAAIDPTKAGKLFTMGANEKEGILEDEDEDEDYEDEEAQALRFPGFIIDTMAINIPQKYFNTPALQVTASCMSSADPNQRKAGCALLGLIAEGVGDHLRTILAHVLPPLLTSVQDGEYFVREVACFALGQMSEHCQPEILSFNQKVLPVIFTALDDPHQTIQTTTCWVLEMFCENLQPETLKPYLPDMLQKLTKLLQNESRNIKEMALTAISATATASEAEFVPYVPPICSMLHPLILLEGEKEESLRGRALECLSHIALAVGKKEFAPYFLESMNAAGKALKQNAKPTDAEPGDESGSDLLTEYVFVFFCNAAKVMKEDFAAYFGEVMPYIFAKVKQEEMFTFGGEEEDDDEEDGNAEAGGDEEEYEDVDDDDDDEVHYIDEGLRDSKKAAVSCLGVFAESCPEQFHPYLTNAITFVMEHGCTSMHASIQSESMLSLGLFVTSVAKLSGVTKPDMGVLVQPNPALADLFNHTNRSVIITLLCTMQANRSKTVVCSAMGVLGEVLNDIGVIALNYDVTHTDKNEGGPVFQGVMANNLVGLILILLQEKAPCQKVVEAKDEDDEEDEDSDEITDSITDLLGTLARALGPSFIPYFDQYFLTLMKYTKPTRAHVDRCNILGCFGEVMKELGPGSIKYAEAVLPAVQAGLSDQMETVRRNAAYCVGNLVTATEKQLAPHFPHILQLLAPLCQRKEEHVNLDDGGADTDNALSAVCRLIKAAPEAVPLPQVLPVIIAALPLRADHEEGGNIYECLIELMKASEPTIMAHFATVIAIFGTTIMPGAKSDRETKVKVSSAVHAMTTSPAHAAPLQAAIEAVADPVCKAALAQAASNTLVLPAEEG